MQKILSSPANQEKKKKKNPRKKAKEETVRTYVKKNKNEAEWIQGKVLIKSTHRENRVDY